MKKKAIPRPEERKSYQTDTEYQGKKYGLSVSDKVGGDGIIESHFKYEPHFRPKGTKHRGGWNMGRCLCEPKRTCEFHKRKKLK